MPDRGPTSGRWRVLGRLLPRDVRERIFEPAFSDLLRASLTSPRDRLPFGLLAVATLLGCVPVAVPRLFVRDGRLTGLGRASLVALLVVGVGALVVANLDLPAYASSP